MLEARTGLIASVAVFGITFTSLPAQGGIKLEDEKSGTVVDLGGRLQFQTILNDDDFIKNNGIEYKVRRARFRMGITPHPWWAMFLQTEFSNDTDPTGGDVRLIDAHITFKPTNWIQVVGGERMAPVSRQNLTSSGGLMAIDRPNQTNYVLTWGLNGRTRLNNSALPGTGAGTVGDVGVRDLGITLFGSDSINPTTHLKYYLGVSDGSTVRQDDDERFSARAQVNFFDAEPGYFNLSTYLGKKKTIGVGVGYDSQDGIAVDSVTGSNVDYEFLTLDGFVDWPVGPGYFTGEVGYNDLDLGDTPNPLGSAIGTPLSGANPANQSQGDGTYFQAGYYLNKFQPWVEFEQWDADAPGDAGDWDAFRVGVSYFFKGHNANAKLGYEQTSNDTPGQVDVDTFILGAYVTF